MTPIRYLGKTAFRVHTQNYKNDLSVRIFFYSLVIVLLSACNVQPPTPENTALEPQANYWQLMGQSIGNSSNASIAAGNTHPVIAYQNTSLNTAQDQDLIVKQWSSISASWNPLGTAVSDKVGFGAISIALDSANAAIVAYSSMEPGTSNYRVYVKKWNGLTWDAFGGVSATLNINPAYTATWVSMDLTTTNQPVVAWIETEILNSTAGKLYVKRWNGSSWTNYSTTPVALNIFSAGHAIGGQLALDNNNRPVVAWLERETYQTGLYGVYVKRWNGSSWVQYGTGGKLNSQGTFSQPSLVIDNLNKPIVAWQEIVNNVGQIFVKRFDTSWTFFGNNPINIKPTQSAYAPKLAMDTSGKPAIVWTEYVGSQLALAKKAIYVKQWNGTQWALKGSVVDYGNSIGLTFDSTNTPFVVLSVNELFVRRFVTGAWQPYAEAVDITLSNDAILSSIARTSNNRPIIAWRESVSTTNRNIYVKEWMGTYWKSLGAVDRNINNPVGKTSIAAGSDNKPVVAWNETSFNGTSYQRDVFVSRWSGSQWIPLGGALSTIHNDEWPVIVLNSSNTPFVTWQSCNTTGFCGVYVKKWDGVNWVDMRGLNGFSPLNTVSATFSTITLDVNGNPVVAWSEAVPGSDTYTIRVKRWNGVNWGSSVLTITDVTTYDISIDVGSDNAIYLAAAKKVNELGNYFSKLIVFKRLGSQTTTFTDSQNRIHLNHNSNAYSPSLGLDSNNYPVVAWTDIPFTSNASNNIEVRRWNGTDWARFGPNSVEDRYFDNSTSPALVLKTNNNPIVSFTTNKSDGNLANIMVKQY